MLPALSTSRKRHIRRRGGQDGSHAQRDDRRVVRQHDAVDMVRRVSVYPLRPFPKLRLWKHIHIDPAHGLTYPYSEFDPWRSASMSSVFRPGGPQGSTRETPVFLVPGARHCNDLTTGSGTANEDMRRAQLRAIAKMVEWVVEFYDLKERGEIGEDGWMV